MIQMETDDKNKDKNFNDIRELLKKHYKPVNNINADKLWDNLSKKIDSLYHKEIISDKAFDNNGNLLSQEDRYWLGFDEYIKNETSSIKHKIITEHLLSCKECRKNHNDFSTKKNN